jgi:hypothetical protein
MTTNELLAHTQRLIDVYVLSLRTYSSDPEDASEHAAASSDLDEMIADLLDTPASMGRLSIDYALRYTASEVAFAVLNGDVADDYKY